MSGLFNQASLVLVPSGYKAGKVYSEVPTNGDGDLTFTRASSATRVNSDGLIEIPRTNFLLNSEEFDNASWEKFRAGTGSIPVVTANYSTAPDGSQTADRVQLSIGSGTATGDISYLFQSASTSGATFSIYAKSNTTPCVVYFRNGDDVTTINITTSWQRFELFRSASITGVQFGLRGADYGGATNSSAVDISVWGAQLEVGSTATEYIPTTTSVRTTFAGITQDGTSASNVPRLDYSQGSCPALLLEPQRTNLALYSEEFDNAYWAKRGSTITSNATTAPDGQITADELKDDTSSFLHDVSFTPTGYAENSYFTLSAFVKANTLSACRLILSQTPNVNFAFASFNLSTQATSASIGGNFTNATSKIDSLANGWFRVSLTFKTGLGGTLSWSNTGCSIRLEKPYQTQIYTGTGQSLYLWGAQLEQGAYATSYIKTTSATVTRLADTFSRNNIYTNGLISASGGTWFVELKNNVAYTRDISSRFGIGDSVGLNVNAIFFLPPSTTNRYQLFKIVGGALTNLFTTTTDNVKIAIKWDGATADIFENGVKVVSATAFNVTNMENLITTGGLNPTFIQAMQLYPTPLSDSDCISLTTL